MNSKQRRMAIRNPDTRKARMDTSLAKIRDRYGPTVEVHSPQSQLDKWILLLILILLNLFVWTWPVF